MRRLRGSALLKGMGSALDLLGVGSTQPGSRALGPGGAAQDHHAQQQDWRQVGAALRKGLRASPLPAQPSHPLSPAPAPEAGDD